MNNRIERFRKLMETNEIDGMIVSNPVNVRYLTGLNVEGFLIINDSENIFITDSRYTEEVNNKLTIEDEINLIDIKDLCENDYFSFFQNCEKVGFEENYVTYAKYNEMIRKYKINNPIETNDILEKMRVIKDEDEIRNIEKACNITDQCFLYLQDYIKVGMTEKQIAFEIEKFFIEHGAEGVAFETIVASGENTSKPHAIPSDREILYGDPILIDFGAKYNGYCADMTRTIFVGYVSDEAKKLYELVLRNQDMVFNKMKENADANIIAKSVQNTFNANDYELIHALGHGVGLDIHEIPIISSKRNAILKENMVVTNEPGIYISGKIGIRIEDTLVINNMSARCLTKSNKNLLIIKG